MMLLPLPTGSVLLFACLAVYLGEVASAPLAGPGEDVTQNEVWLPESDDLGALPLDIFVTRPSKKTVSFKSLIKAIHRFNSVEKPDPDRPPSTENPGEAVPTDPPEDEGEASTPVAPLVDDLSDLFYITAQMELDKSHKFTHSFRFGYGSPN